MGVEVRQVREEHRVITIVFADLAGSTALGERLDSEEVKLVVGEAVGRIVIEIERLGGYVKDLAGDGVLAFFGAPVSYEDDAERAARAALNVVATVSSYGVEVARSWNVEALQARVGIATGPVSLGLIGAGRRVEYSAFGDTVNTAARIQTAASPGATLVDERTKRLVDPIFEWGEPVDLMLKGKAERVRAFPLRGALPSLGTRPWRATTDVMVGRAREISALKSALADLAAGAGGILFITGEAGLGKSRLLVDARAASTTQAESPILWLEGRCVSYSDAVPYFPFRGIVREWLGVSESDPELRVRIALRRKTSELFGEAEPNVYPYLASLLDITGDSGEARPDELQGEELRQRIFASVARLFERLSEDRPVVVAIEDLHWADATSIDLMRSLLGVVERSALLLVPTLRDERDHVAWGLKEAAARDYPHLADEIALSPLEADAEHRLLQQLIGANTLTPELEQRVIGTADGNPLFLEELVRSLIDAGVLGRSEGSEWRLEENATIVVPETIEKVILARADRLTPACHAVLTAASVVGREFEVSLLEELVGRELSLDDEVHELQRLGFIVAGNRRPRLRYRFKHVLIQEALYRRMLGDERQRLHRAVADSLERLEQKSHEDVIALARHWAAAGVTERAIAYYRKGAELALRVSANGEVVEALTSALDLLRREPPGRARDEQELQLRMMIGVPLVVLGGYGSGAVREHYSIARDLCLSLGLPVSPPILRGLAINAITRLELDDARRHGKALIAAAESDGDPMLMVEGQYVLGVTTFWFGEFTASRLHLEEAIARYSADRHEAHVSLYSQDPKVVCLSRLAWTLWFLGYPEQARAARDDSVALAAELGHPFTASYANAFGAIVSLALRDDRGAADLAASLAVQASDERYRYWQILVDVLRHWPAAKAGDRHAIDAMRSAVNRFDETGQTLHATWALSLAANAYLDVGETDAGLEAVAEALDRSEHAEQRYLDSEFHRLRGELLAVAGAPASEFEAAFSTALAVARSQSAKATELRAAVALARRQPDAIEQLADVYGWFTEGHEAPDLRAARELLDRPAEKSL